jgi:choline dehydrogenase-like flavoprotein
MTCSQDTSPVFDALIAGSGAGGSAAAYRLAMAGWRISILEKERELPRENSTPDVDQVVHQGTFRSKERWRDGLGKEFAPEEYFNVGGKTKWHGVAPLRFGRHEFEVDPAHQCLGWPLSYDDLQPYYDEAERHLGVRTFAIEPDLDRMVRRLAAASPDWQALPLHMGLRSAILQDRVEASHFDGLAYVSGRKADGETAFLFKISGNPNVSIITGTPVVDLVADEHDATRIGGVLLNDGRTLHARSVLLACGALHWPRLLQRYPERHGLTRAFPGYHLVGSHLKLDFLTAVVALSLSRKTDLLCKTTRLLQRALPHSSTQSLGFDGEVVATLVPRYVPRSIAAQLGKRAYGFFLQTEDGSHVDNGVRQGEGTLPVLDYLPTRNRAASAKHEELVRCFRSALAKIRMLALSMRIGLAGTAYACGTLVAGVDPSLPSSIAKDRSTDFFAACSRRQHLAALKSCQSVARHLCLGAACGGFPGGRTARRAVTRTAKGA